MMFQRINEYLRSMWLYTKYQLVTKTVLALVILPFYQLLVHSLLKSAGRTNISSGDFFQFLFSFQGVGLLVVTVVLVFVFIGLDIVSFIRISAMIQERKVVLGIREMMVVSLRSLKHFLKPSGILIALFVTLIVPLVGLGLTIAPMSEFQIPNFITSVIYANPLYATLYTGLLVALFIVGLIYMFVFHYVILLGKNVAQALRLSRRFMAKYWARILLDLLLRIGIWTLVATLVFAGLMVLVVIPTYLGNGLFVSRVVSLFVFILVSEVAAYAVFMTVPVTVHRMTVLFYRYHTKEGEPVRMAGYDEITADLPVAKIRVRAKIGIALFVAGTLVFNLAASLVLGFFFDDVFVNRAEHKEIVAHRGGGDLGAENSIDGTLKLVERTVKWSEVDIQRTADGHYILNHDSNFSRVCGVAKASSQMRLEEIRALQIRDLFDPARPSQPVPTLEELLDACKGKVGLFLELKGATADEQMVDDVVKAVRERNMEHEVVLLSLDYALIRYIEQHYPQMTSGYLYYFAIGRVEDLVADYLVMEEREATPGMVARIHQSGKRVIVWTVNTEESIKKFIHSDVDGIITDYVDKVKKAIKDSQNRTDLEIIVDFIFAE